MLKITMRRKRGFKYHNNRSEDDGKRLRKENRVKEKKIW